MNDVGDFAPERVFHGVSFCPVEHTIREFTAEQVDRELRDNTVFSWIDLQADTVAPLNEVLAHVGIDLTLGVHFDAPEVLPRIHEHPKCLAFNLYEIEDPERHLDTSHGIKEIESLRMILVLGANFVITFHRRRLDVVQHVKDSCAYAFRLAGKTPGFIAFLFLQRCVYDFAHLNLANDNYLDVLETKLLHEQPVTGEIAIAGRNILTLKKLAASLSIVLTLIATKRSPFISNEARASFNEMLQNGLALRAAIDSSRDMLDGILAGIQADAMKQTSEIARVLTVVSAVLLPLTVITGIYGMNFENMPELGWFYGYAFALGMMVIVAGVMLLVFLRLGWLRKKR